MAWKRWLTFWVPFGVFFSWIAVMTVLLLKAIAQEDDSSDDGLGELGASPAQAAARMDLLEAEAAALREELAQMGKLLTR